MMSMFDVKKKYGIPFNTSRKAALNRILRRIVPGGADVLDALSRVHEMQHSRNYKDPALQYILEKLVSARDSMRESFLKNFSPEQKSETSFPEPHRSHYQAQGEIEKNGSNEQQEESLDDLNSLLGTMPDTLLAKRFGITHAGIAKRRRKHGIKPYGGEKKRIDWSQWDKMILNSTSSTQNLAKAIGCDESTVRERKRFLTLNQGKYSS